MDLNAFERLLPPSPPLAGRWWAYRCRDCEAVTLTDVRLQRLLRVRAFKRLGLVALHCEQCQGTALDRCGYAVS